MSDSAAKPRPDPRAGAYLRAAVMTATPEQLRMMLLDGAVRFARRSKDALEARDHEGAYIARSRCRDIVLELLTTIKDEPYPELAARVRAVYTFIYNALATAGIEKSAAAYDKVIELLEFERETWALLIEKLGAERAGEGPAIGASA